MSAAPRTGVTTLRDRIKRNSTVITESGSKNTTTPDQGSSDGAIGAIEVGK